MPSSASASPTSRASEAASGAAGAHVGERALLARKLVLLPLLAAQAVRTRRRALAMPEAAGARSGRFPATGGGEPVRVLVAGDSSAAGVGVETQDRAVVGHLAAALAAASGRPVAWALLARTGLSTRGVHALLAAAPPAPADVAVVVTGVNDVTALLPPARAVRHRAALADWLLAEGLARHVVFAPLPPMERFPLLPEPLRGVLGADARRHDAALARWATGRRDVSHVPIELDLAPASMAADGFHPGEPVYRACGTALGRHVAALLDRPSPDTPPTTRR